MVSEVKNINKEPIMVCWRYFFRMQICEVGNLEQKLYFANIKYRKANENADDKEKEKYQRLINKTTKKYNSAIEKLELIERLHGLIITNNYSLSNYKEFNIIKEEYEEKRAINFTGTGYVFKQSESESSILGFGADLFKDGRRVNSNV